MDEIDRIGRDGCPLGRKRGVQDAAIRSMAHSVWVYFAALMAEGFLAVDALEITLSWQTVMAMRGQGE